MTKLVRIQAILEHRSGLPENNAVNTWHFTCADADIDDIGLVATDVQEFYSEEIAPFMNPWTEVISSTMTSVFTKGYDMTGPAPHPPMVETIPVPLPSLGGGINLPSECAMTLSYAGTPLPGVDQRNRRGRLFLGPLKTNAKEEVVHVPRLLVPDNLGPALERLQSDALGHGFIWVVHSPTLGTQTPVVSAYIDNAFDTVRKRGEETTLRTVVFS